MEAEASPLHVEFPDFSCSILQKLNRQRQLGQLCDITVVIQGHRFRAHRAVLAASSPYFCDQVLLKNSMRVVLPDVMLPSVFESLLHSCYTGTLLLPAGEVVAFLTAASFLQMWHVVDKCTELLEGNPAAVCRKSEPGSARPSPGNSGYGSPSEGFDLAPELGLFGRTSDCEDGEAESQGRSPTSGRAREPGAGPSGRRGRGQRGDGVPVRQAAVHPAQHHAPQALGPGEGRENRAGRLRRLAGGDGDGSRRRAGTTEPRRRRVRADPGARAEEKPEAGREESRRGGTHTTSRWTSTARPWRSSPATGPRS
ncbi:hypothetical protein ANANG_G00192540, partial [Anguilla anguilla]